MKQDDIIKKWVKETGREKPSTGFSQRVMAAVEKSRSSVRPYTPVISPWVLRLVFGGLATLYAVVLFFFPEQTGSSTYMNQLRSFTDRNIPDVPNVSLPAIELPHIDWGFLGSSPVYFYSLLALATMAIIMAWKQAHQTSLSQTI